MNPLSILRRAFNSNLSSIQVSDGEKTKLNAAGVTEPLVQRYLVWRRAMILMVVIGTLLSAGLWTFIDATDTGEEPDVLASLTSELMEGVQTELTGEAPAAKTAEETEPAEPSTAATTAAAEEEDNEEEEPETAFSKFADLAHTAVLYALPAAALLALFLGNRVNLSFKVLALGFAFGFFVPILIALCPWSWFGYEEVKISPSKEPMKFLENVAEEAVLGASYLAMLLPAVLAMVPGVLRACLRVKTLVPGSMLPGWFIVMTAPLYGLFLLATFVAVNQMTNDSLLIGALLLLVGAHLFYAFRATTFSAPLLTTEDFQRMRGAQRVVGSLTLSVGVLVIVYLATREFMGMNIIGSDPKKTLLKPLDLVGFVLELISRSMFITVLGADLFMRMNLAAWKHSKALAESQLAESYDREMSAFGDLAK